MKLAHQEGVQDLTLTLIVTMGNLRDFYQLMKDNYADSNLFKDLNLIHNISNDIQIGINCDFSEMLGELVGNYDSLNYPSITCGILTYNEERCIKRCLESVVNEFDEIIVLDSVSEDNTVKIIKENFNDVKVYVEPWKNDFSFHRNKIINLATCDWIYFIDADNYYDSKNKGKAMRIAKVMDFLKIEGVVSPTVIEHDNSMSRDTRKMFRLKDNILFSGKVHEEPVYANGEIPRNIIVDINVFHDGYNPKIINMMEKNERNITLTKEMMKIEPNNPKWLYFYSRELYQTQRDIALVQSVLFKALELYENSSYTRYYVDTIALLCRVLFESKNYQKLTECLNILENNTLNCSDIDYYNSALLFYNLLLRIKKISSTLKENIDMYERDYHSFINPSHDHIKILILNMLLLLGDYQDAFKVYKEIKSIEIKDEFLVNVNKFKDNLLSFIDSINKI